MNKSILLLLVILSTSVLNSNAQEDKKDKKVYVRVEEMPKYPGGESQIRTDLAEKLKYPEVAHKKGIEGKVYVTFVVDEQGKMVDPKIVRGVDPLLDAEALRVVKEMNKVWTPGMQEGKPVKVSYTMPINFALGDCKSKSGNQERASKKKGDVYYIVEVMPEFPGGDYALRDYISNNVKYPDEAKKNGIQGKVYVTFIVNTDGTVGGAKVVRGVDPILDKEALRVVKTLPKWKPGKQDGEAVKVSYTVPINFALS